MVAKFIASAQRFLVDGGGSIDNMIGKLKKYLSELRLRTRVAAFGNNHSFLVNHRYLQWERHCRKRWKPYVSISEADELNASNYRRNGYLAISSPVSERAARELGLKVDAAFDDGTDVVEVGKGLFRLTNGLERFPEIMQFAGGAVERALEAYFRSHFKIYAVSFYRTVPNPEAPKSSFLWHFDNVPDQELKLMVYLDDVAPDTGAFRLKDRQLSEQLRARGAWHREQAKRHISVLEDESTTVTFTGPPGTCTLFANGRAIHKATAPSRLHRDVVTMVIIPSDIWWREHFARHHHKLSTNSGICINPFTDSPENIGFRY